MSICINSVKTMKNNNIAILALCYLHQYMLYFEYLLEFNFKSIVMFFCGYMDFIPSLVFF